LIANAARRRKSAATIFRGLNEAAAAAARASGFGERRLAERTSASKPTSRSGAGDGRVERASSPHDRGHDDPRHAAGDATIAPRRRFELQPIFRGRSPERPNLDDVRALQVDLASTGVPWARLGQIACALRFSKASRSAKRRLPERIAYAREPRKAPAAASADEVAPLLESVSSLAGRR
jgi:hypothetical protein